MAGKGSSPRPIPNRQQFDTNWDSIFKKEKKDVEDMGEGAGREGVDMNDIGVNENVSYD